MKTTIIPSILCFLFSSCADQDSVTKLRTKPTFEKVQFLHVLPKLDILMVLDKTYLDESHRQYLAAHVEHLLAPIRENPVIDYRVGIITASVGPESDSENICDLNGRLLRPQDGGPLYSQRETPEATQQLQEILGRERDCFPFISHHWPFQAVSASLSNGSNQGFYRRGASLAVFFITDTQGEEGDMSAQDFKHFLLELKGEDSERIGVYGAIVEKDDPFDCREDGDMAVIPSEISTAIANFNGQGLNVCSPFMERELGKMGQDISNRFGDIFIPLDEVPASGTITVSYGGRPIQKIHEGGWSYDPNRRGIRVSERVELPPGEPAEFFEIIFYPAKLD